jgi:hypothetical protein
LTENDANALNILQKGDFSQLINQIEYFNVIKPAESQDNRKKERL